METLDELRQHLIQVHGLSEEKVMAMKEWEVRIMHRTLHKTNP